jgi:NTP pyrophosphatase (non-canonical NTP hydrolase)
MPDETTSVAALKAEVRRFAAVRNWDPYHSPKNLAMALACEAGELLEPYRWLSDAESRQLAYRDAAAREAIADEIADVANLLLQLCLHTGIDLSDAMRAKMARNERKYPPPG